MIQTRIGEVMSNMIRLLDCTLRDGGYVNDWKFGRENLSSVYERLVDSGVDIVEIGFLDDRRPFDIDRSIMPDTACVDKIYGKVRKRSPMTVGMIDYGTCDISRLQPCEESMLDGIRVIFKKYRMRKALEFCAEVKKLGYIVFAQLVSVTSYNDEELLEVVGLANQVKPDTLSMVDTYGLLDPDRVKHIAHIMDDNLDKDIAMGFHGHNNMQLAFANTLTFLEEVAPVRNVVVDGSLHGMGKSAGNAPIELLAAHLNEKYGKAYDIGPLLEAIDESVLEFYKKTPWGYKVYFYLCAHNKVHPDYVKQMQGKPDVSVSAINEVLGQIEPEENKLLYDKEACEAAWAAYEKSHYDDEENTRRLSAALSACPSILLLGPGRSISLQREKVLQFIERQDPVIISLNYIPDDLPVDYVFITKSNRYLEMANKLLAKTDGQVQIIATSNIVSRDIPFTFVFRREPLLEKKESIVDNSILMLLRVLKRCGVKKLSLAGFDGYSDRDENYFNPQMEYAFIRNQAGQLNRHIRDVLESEYADMKLDFLTYSRYTTIQDSYDAGF